MVYIKYQRNYFICSRLFKTHLVLTNHGILSGRRRLLLEFPDGSLDALGKSAGLGDALVQERLVLAPGRLIGSIQSAGMQVSNACDMLVKGTQLVLDRRDLEYHNLDTKYTIHGRLDAPR